MGRQRSVLSEISKPVDILNIRLCPPCRADGWIRRAWMETGRRKGSWEGNGDSKRGRGRGLQAWDARATEFTDMAQSRVLAGTTGGVTGPLLLASPGGPGTLYTWRWRPPGLEEPGRCGCAQWPRGRTPRLRISETRGGDFGAR